MTPTIEAKTAVTVSSLLHDSAAYNAWANKRLVDWLQTKPTDLMDQQVPSSFPTLKATLVHIWDTQRFWLAIVQQAPVPVSFRQVGFYGTLDEVFTEIVAQSEQFSAYVQSLTEAELEEEVYFTTPWVDGVQTRISFIHHCMNHSTYHRGQVVTIGRIVGLTDAPMTDYSFYRLIG
ncbi:damage-inducible protein DinB [Spirosoma sp. HMF4905]|uniref:Damage-inducible protein DinB n=1 Tax=Spirosoma arboris TaxID=2682092 RepID=A0A7K1SC61_9BACT|nr:DinB family protein [Spirosoma arboris]MVM31355.1 damage-inducible protein DinB [Spirosoma arboris]